jgi:phage FluMu gp28-like protein
MTVDLSDGVLLDYQKRWIADESQLKIVEKSRRTGMTWAEAADAVLTASLVKSDGGHDHYYLGAGKEMASEFIDACADWALQFGEACGEIEEEILKDGEKDITTYKIPFASGCKIMALSSKPSNLRGRQGSLTVDEAAFHEHLDEVLKAAQAFTMWGGKVRVISTHNGVDNLFNELIQDSRAGKRDFSVHRLTLDDACQDGLYKRICLVRGKTWSQEKEDEWKAKLLRGTATKDDALEEYYCVPKQGGGVYLSRTLIESRMVDVPVIRQTGSKEFNELPVATRSLEMRQWCDETLLPLLEGLDADERHCLGEDFARSGDLTVLVPLSISQQLKRRVPFQVELRNMPFAQQREILWYILDRLPNFSGAAMDATGNGQQIAEETADAYGTGMIEEVSLSQKWYLENMPRLKAAFEDDDLAIPKDDDVLTDFRAIQMVKGVPKVPDGNTGKGKGDQRHGDAAIATALAWYASVMDVYEYKYETVALKGDDAEERQVHCTLGGFGRGRSII